MLNRFRPTAVCLIVCVLVVAAVAPAAAQDARQIIETTMERYERRVASVESVTIVQEVMGMESTTRLRKVMIEDHPVLVPSSAGRGGDLGSTYRSFEQMAKGATLKGTESVDGHSCWVIHVTDLGGMHVAAEGTSDFESSDGTLFIDKDTYVMRRMLMNGVSKRNGTKQPVTLKMQIKDYREVDGWLHPFLTEVSLGGEGGGETAEIAEMRKAMAQMKEELAKMPPEQREMMEKMMKGRMPQLEGMAEGGEMKITVTVKEVRVNAPE